MLYGITNPHGGDIYGGGVTLDFSANTNPFGTPEGVMEAVRSALPEMHPLLSLSCGCYCKF